MSDYSRFVDSFIPAAGRYSAMAVVFLGTALCVRVWEHLEQMSQAPKVIQSYTWCECACKNQSEKLPSVVKETQTEDVDEEGLMEADVEN